MIQSLLVKLWSELLLGFGKGLIRVFAGCVKDTTRIALGFGQVCVQDLVKVWSRFGQGTGNLASVSLRAEPGQPCSKGNSEAHWTAFTKESLASSRKRNLEMRKASSGCRQARARIHSYGLVRQ